MNNIQEHFLNYELSKELKELGFDYDVLYAYCTQGGWNKYSQKHEEISYILKTDGNPFGSYFSGKNWNKQFDNNTKSKIVCSAPLISQVRNWLISNYSINYSVFNERFLTEAPKEKQVSYTFVIWDIYHEKEYKGGKDINFLNWDSYQEAELEAIKECIKIIKEK